MALSKQGEVSIELAWRSEQNHSVELVPALRLVMAQAKVVMEEIEAIFVARGPGGFSALRVGISVAKSLAAARAIPLVAVGSLDIEAQPYLGLGLPVCAVIGAGGARLYAATYDAQVRGVGSTRAEYRVETHESLGSCVKEATLFCGEGVRSIANVLRERLETKSLLVDAPPPTRRPEVLAQLGYLRLRDSDIDDPELLQPLYMRGSQFEIAQRNLGQKQWRADK